MNHSRKKRYLSFRASLLAAVLLAGFYTALCLWCQPGSFFGVSGIRLLQLPVLIGLNAMPVGLTLLAAAFLFGNVFYGAALAGTFWSALSIANRIKIEVRDEPVFPRDISLLKEVGSAISEYDFSWPWGVIALVAVSALLLVIAGRYVGCRKPDLSRGKEVLLRLGGAAVSLIVLVALILTVYSSNALYNLFRVSNAYYVPSVFNEMGFPYCFCHHFTTYLVERPEGYSRQEAMAWDNAETVSNKGKDVHVIMVMNEAFSDLTARECFTYPAYPSDANPLANYQALQSSGAISGGIVTPTFAGGTANTEFDVLTGMRTQGLGPGTTSAMRAVNSDLDSLFRIFEDADYLTSYIHPGDDWFYNRENVMDWMGAEKSLFIDEMENVEYKGRWVTDNYTAAVIEEQFADAVAQGETLFSYITTIQNHMSYTLDKYGEDYVFPQVETDLLLSQEALDMLSVYIEGIRDADAMLGRLAAYFSATDEPVVLVFFGDHLPYLGDNRSVYRELGLQAALSDVEAATPYLIWANDAAQATLDWDTTVAALDLPADGRISACFLGQLVLELTGHRDDQAWFSWLGDLRRELPVIQGASCITADGTIRAQADLSDNLSALIHKMDCWSYYKLRQKELD